MIFVCHVSIIRPRVMCCGILNFYHIINLSSRYHAYAHPLMMNLYDRSEFDAMKKSVSEKRKTYRCIIYTSCHITPQLLETTFGPYRNQELVVQQGGCGWGDYLVTLCHVMSC